MTNIIDFQKQLATSELQAQIKILESLKINKYDTQEGLGGTYGDNYVSMTQISKKINFLKTKLKKLK